MKKGRNEWRKWEPAQLRRNPSLSSHACCPTGTVAAKDEPAVARLEEPNEFISDVAKAPGAARLLC